MCTYLIITIIVVEPLQALWNVVKQISQSKVPGAGIGRLDQTYAILCGLADFFSSPGNYNLFDKADFWEIIQKGLVLNEPLSRKRAMYLLKRALDLLDKQPSDLSVMSEKGCCIFYWSSGKKESLMSTWQDFVLLMETLDEKQVLQILHFFGLMETDFSENIMLGLLGSKRMKKKMKWYEVHFGLTCMFNQPGVY